MQYKLLGKQDTIFFFLLQILIPQVLLNWPVYTGTKQAKAIKFKTPANEVGKNQCAAVIHIAIQDCPSVKNYVTFNCAY